MQQFRDFWYLNKLYTHYAIHIMKIRPLSIVNDSSIITITPALTFYELCRLAWILDCALSTTVCYFDSG